MWTIYEKVSRWCWGEKVKIDVLRMPKLSMLVDIPENIYGNWRKLEESIEKVIERDFCKLKYETEQETGIGFDNYLNLLEQKAGIKAEDLSSMIKGRILTDFGEIINNSNDNELFNVIKDFGDETIYKDNNINPMNVKYAKGYYRAVYNSVDELGNIDYVKEEKFNPPEPSNTYAGRCNPHGIPYLYVADSPITCIHELKPHLKSSIEIALYLPSRDLRIKSFILNENDNEHIVSAKELFNQKFSRPYQSEYRKEKDYKTTQCIIEYIKNCCTDKDGNRYDGVKYASSVKEGGECLVLFDVNSMYFCKFYGRKDVEKISYEDNNALNSNS